MLTVGCITFPFGYNLICFAHRSKFQQKLAKREGATIDRSQDIVRLQEFYKLYRQKNNVEQLREEETKLRESGVYSGNLGE